jgi:hypothetical protein
MGKLRILATTVLVAGALLPALVPHRAASGEPRRYVAAIEALRPLPLLRVDAAKLNDLEVAWASLRAYQITADNKMDTSDRAKVSEQAFRTDSTVRAALAENERASNIYFRRQNIFGARRGVLASVLMLVAALGVLGGLRRFKRGSWRVGALLFVPAIALAPLAIPRVIDGNFYVPIVYLAARAPASIPPGDWTWRTPKPAPDREVWSAASIEKTRAVADPNVGTAWYADDGLTPINYAGVSRWATLFPSVAAAVGALLASLVLSRLPQFFAWSPAWRRNFPTLWPVRARPDAA